MANQIPPVEMSNLDSGHVLKYAFDESTGRIRVDAQVTANISGEQEVIISHTDDSIKVGDGTNLAAINSDGAIKVSGGLVKSRFNNIQASHTATTSQYVYKLNSTTVSTVDITYTDSTKTEISSLVVS
jgi:hypothetical protein